MHNYLRTHSQANLPLDVAAGSVTSSHLDEDALVAFVEGRLGEQESTPLVAHMVGCAACRHIGARLIRLQTEVENTPLAAPIVEEPGRVRRLLDDLASRLSFASGEESVFAYHAPADDFGDAPREGEAKRLENEEANETAAQDSSDKESQKQ